MVVSSSRLQTLPVGLCGLHSSKNAVVGTGERGFQFVHVAAPLTLIKLERHRGNAALVAVDSFVKTRRKPGYGPRCRRPDWTIA